MITIKQIAEYAAVSPTTVSNVLHGNTSHVSPETIEKVRNILKEHDYVPNMGAMILAHSFSRIIGVILNYTARSSEKTFMDPFEGELLSALEERIRQNGYYTMLSVAETAGEVIQLAETWKIDGLIIIGLQRKDFSHLRAKTQLPMVFVDCYFDDGAPYYNIGLDDRGGSRSMTEYLISMGHRKIAFLADKQSPVGVDRERLEGVKDAFTAHGLPFTARNFISLSRDEQERHRNLDDVISHRKDYTALFFSSDYYACDAVNYLSDQGLSVPDDFSVAGFDDNIFSRCIRPRITTVHQDVSEKGALAVEMLIKLIKKEPVENSSIKLGTSLVIRDSVKPPEAFPQT